MFVKEIQHRITARFPISLLLRYIQIHSVRVVALNLIKFGNLRNVSMKGTIINIELTNS